MKCWDENIDCGDGFGALTLSFYGLNSTTLLNSFIGKRMIEIGRAHV